MIDPVALFLGALAVQVPLAVLVFIDAKRVGFDDPNRYAVGVLAPAAGFLFLPYYVSRRRTAGREHATSGGRREPDSEAERV